MAAMLDRLGRISRPLVLLVAALLVVGVTLTGLNMLLVGWTVYAIGHVGAIVAFLAIAAANRRSMDGWAWAGLGVLLVGLVLALPAIASIWSTYLDQPAGREMMVPLDMAPLGAVAEIVTWVGLAFYGLAARGVGSLPAGVGWIFVAAAAVGLVADFRLISPLAWAGSMLLVVLGLLAVSAPPRAEPSSEAPRPV